MAATTAVVLEKSLSGARDLLTMGGLAIAVHDTSFTPVDKAYVAGMFIQAVHCIDETLNAIARMRRDKEAPTSEDSVYDGRAGLPPLSEMVREMMEKMGEVPRGGDVNGPTAGA